MATVNYGITLSYAHNWTMANAIREIWSNARDLPKANMYHNGQYLEIEDYGTGIPKEALLLGFSENRDNQNTLGMFGEGLKIAALVAVRENRLFKVETVGWQASFGVTRTEFGEALCAYVEPSNKRQGTLITIEASESEYLEVQELFREFRQDEEIAPGIFTSPAIYILGMKSSDWEGLYGYEIGKQNSNHRDRTGLETSLKKAAVRTILQSTESSTVALRYLTGYQDFPNAEEYSISYLYPAYTQAWKEAVTNKFGDKVCYSSSQASDYKAKADGWTVLGTDAPQIIKSTYYAIGIKSAETVIEPSSPKAINWKELPAAQASRFKAGMKLCQHLSPTNGRGEEIRYHCFNRNDPSNNAWYSSAGVCVNSTDIWISEQALLNRVDTIGTFLHELAHAISLSADFTEGFQEALTQLLGEMAFQPTLRIN